MLSNPPQIEDKPMLVFITYIIKLIIKLIFVDEIAEENEELKQKVQRIEQEKEEIAQAKQQLEQNNQDLIQQNFNLVRKYIAVNQQKEKLIKELDLYKFPDINQEFHPDDWDVIDQLLRDFNSTDSLTI